MIKVKWTDNTSKVLADLQRQGLQFVAEGGDAIRTEMGRRSPKRTGNLINSIQVSTYIEDGIPTSETGPSADYAEYVEYGTSKMEAQPFAEPGFQAAQPEIKRLAERIMRL